MSATFHDQGGAARMDPSPPVRWLASQMMTRMADRARRDARRARAERRRRSFRAPHVIEYFHQVDDAYSVLAVQLLAPLLARYDVRIEPHLVRGPEGRNAPEPELLLELAVRDARTVAPHYGLEFPDAARRPAAEAVGAVERLLAPVRDSMAFAELAVSAGLSLFASDLSGLAALAAEHPPASAEATTRALELGTARRARLGHYSGGMFHYAGEWYWGVDRLYHLEDRLVGLGASRGGEPLAPRPAIEYGPRQDDGRLTLEFYPSLRSPYTSLIFDVTVELAARTGVRLDVRPVLPMVMRGVPATRQKGGYIMFDASREAATLGLDWGRIYDPIGDPVRRAYSLYPWALERGRGNELLSAFLRAAFFDGVNTNRAPGLQRVVEAAGLDWSEAARRLGDSSWEALLEQNRQAMYGFGCWGVPSYRLLAADGGERLALWGQDRLWLVSREIQRCLAMRQESNT